MDLPDDDTDDDTDDALLDKIIEILLKKSEEQSLMLATLHILLLKHEIFSEQEFDEAFQATGALKDQIVETGKTLEEMLEPSRLHQLLQDYKGRKQ